MGWTRASETDLTLTCPGSLILPRTREETESMLNSADWGKMVHRWAATGEIAAEPGRDKHAEALQDRVALCFGAFEPDEERHRLWPPGGSHEITVAINCRDGSAGMCFNPADSEEWKAKLGDHWITGTADYVNTLPGETPWVDDIKTGKLDTDSPRARAQLWVYALALWILRGKPPQGVMGTVTHWPRYPAPPRTPKPKREGTRYTAEDLTTTLGRLMVKHGEYEALKLSAKDNSDALIGALVKGPHCWWCPSSKNCPLDVEDEIESAKLDYIKKAKEQAKKEAIERKRKNGK